mmetsp:Transcript_10267/g.31635  ORF Transcript_10267/g.31635 Transcript_10267/m.31635 type:complete len:237 (-) Transcript_10267:284-994(-)
MATRSGVCGLRWRRSTFGSLGVRPTASSRCSLRAPMGRLLTMRGRWLARAREFSRPSLARSAASSAARSACVRAPLCLVFLFSAARRSSARRVFDTPAVLAAMVTAVVRVRFGGEMLTVSPSTCCEAACRFSVTAAAATVEAVAAVVAAAAAAICFSACWRASSAWRWAAAISCSASRRARSAASAISCSAARRACLAASAAATAMASVTRACSCACSCSFFSCSSCSLRCCSSCL